MAIKIMQDYKILKPKRLNGTNLRTPPINGYKQKKPYNINKMPIPCCSLKTKVMLRV
jgi:hypothetical protein